MDLSNASDKATVSQANGSLEEKDENFELLRNSDKLSANQSAAEERRLREMHFMKAEEEFRKETTELENQIDRLNVINQQLTEYARKQETNAEDLERKLHIAERSLITSQRESAKLKGILELAKLQGNAQQQVLDVKQDDVIKLAVKQAELYDQIRKLKLTIETLRNKLEKHEAERGGRDHHPGDEGAEHPSNMPLPTSASQTTNRRQNQANIRRSVDRREENSERGPEDVLDHQDITIRESMEENRLNPRRTYKLLLARRTIARANFRIKYHRAINNSLKVRVKQKDNRIRDLLVDKDRILKVLERVRQLAQAKMEVIYKNLLSLPDDIATMTSPLNARETVRAYLKEVDSSASVEEAERIILRLKEFGRFLGSDESFDEFIKNRGKQLVEVPIPTQEISKQSSEEQLQQPDNVTRRRTPRRQKMNKACLDARRRATDARKTSYRKDQFQIKDCRNLGRGGKHCRSCCHDAKMQTMTSLALQAVAGWDEGMPSASATNDGSKEIPVSGFNQGRVIEMVDGSCQVLPEDIDTKSEIDDVSGAHVSNQHPDLSSGQNRQDELLEETFQGEGNTQSGQSATVEENASGIFASGISLNEELCSEDNLEKQKELMKRVSDLLVDKWCLEGQVKALEDNERDLTEAKSEMSIQLNAAHRQLARSCSDTGRPHPSHNVLALQDRLGWMQKRLKEMEDDRDNDGKAKSLLKSELEDSKKKVADLEAVKKRLEGEVEGWMETVMEVRKGRINLLNHMDNIAHKVGRLNTSEQSFKCNEGDPARKSMDDEGNHRHVGVTCGCSSHDVMRVKELEADIETLAEQRKLQDAQIEQLSELLQRSNDEKHELMNHLTEVQQEKRNLQSDFDSILACE
nr:uncharacterized protein LOC129274848 [Lytechinus pictus]